MTISMNHLRRAWVFICVYACLWGVHAVCVCVAGGVHACGVCVCVCRGMYVCGGVHRVCV